MAAKAFYHLFVITFSRAIIVPFAAILAAAAV
jgi:hypothetical protein